MGSGSIEVALVRYSTYTPKEGGSKAKPINQLEVVDVDWDARLGSNTLDMLLVEHFATEFNSQHPELGDVRCVEAGGTGTEGGGGPWGEGGSSVGRPV